MILSAHISPSFSLTMAFTLPHFNCITIISILLSFSFPLVPVSADDSSSTECQYPCLPAPVVPVTYCPPPPPPPPPPLPLSPVTGYWSYPPPPSEYYPYYLPPNKYNMNPSPPPPDPMLPWFPWYYQHKGPSISKGNCVFSQGSLGGSNVVLLGIVAVLMIL